MINQIAFLIVAGTLIICEIFFLIFFRDPERTIGRGIVSPADGKVFQISKVNSKEPQAMVRLAIFMNVTNVHVNRAPLAGKILSMTHFHGGLVPAYRPESKLNERLKTVLKTDLGEVTIIQIAGILAQRIVPYIEPGEYLSKGQRIGIIQFGSRVDLILPANRINIKVNVGDSVHAGSSTIAEIR
jgi:phosphatidylserine decarboxylase